MEHEKLPAEVTVSFTGGLTMKIETTLTKALDVARFLSLSTNDAVSASIIPTSGGTTSLKVGDSPLEALRNTGAKTYAQQITTLGAYVMERNKSESFDPKEVQLLLRRIGNPPQNFGRDLRQATDLLSYLIQEGPNQYKLTDHGKEALANKFEGVVDSIPRRRKSPGRKKTQES